jgi:O-antigen/teichoic acid export membrane protein
VGSIITIFLISSPFSIGYRILIAQGRNDIVLLLGILSTLISSIYFTLCVALRLNAAYWCFYISIGAFITSILSFSIASKRCGITLKELIEPKLTKIVSRQIWIQSAPMLIIAIGLNLALQLDRYLLSVVSTNDELSKYLLAFQIYMPLWSILTALAVNLWPKFRFEDRDNDIQTRIIERHIINYFLLSCFLGLIYIVFSPFISKLFTNGTIVLPMSLRMLFALLLIVQSVQLPIGYYLMETSDLFFQAVIISIMATFNILLTLEFAERIGARGPVLASVITISILQIIPSYWYIRIKHYRRTRGNSK